jgi:GT2 family glycosyltransferase
LDLKPEISVIIPHYNGMQILKSCLNSLYKNSFEAFETFVIDNGSTDGSQAWIKTAFPQVRLSENHENLGYAGACNQGIKLSECPFVLLLNNDTEMPENLLEELYREINTDKKIAAVQPKILSIQNPKYFDYSGAAGGELDIFGYPFARGRVFDQVEEDNNQYDKMENQIFWTSGCALLLRREVVNKIGGLDEDFFAHQEEIDWNWRAQLAGYRNAVTMKTHILHYSGYTLKKENEKKMYLNHRNNLVMMLKNFSATSLLLLFPPRIALEVLTMIIDLFKWDGKRAKAVYKSLKYLIKHSFSLVSKHKEVQLLRVKKDSEITKNMFRSSIVWHHFVKKKSAYICVKKFRKHIA